MLAVVDVEEIEVGRMGRLGGGGLGRSKVFEGKRDVYLGEPSASRDGRSGDVNMGETVKLEVEDEASSGDRPNGEFNCSSSQAAFVAAEALDVAAVAAVLYIEAEGTMSNGNTVKSRSRESKSI